MCDEPRRNSRPISSPQTPPVDLMDLCSQPADARGESTPQSFSSFSRPTTPSVKPVSPDITPMQRKFFKSKGVRGKSSSLTKSRDRTEERKSLVVGQTSFELDMPTISQAVDVNDTFDKLVASAKSKRPQHYEFKKQVKTNSQEVSLS